jgi:hypothetical protein
VEALAAQNDQAGVTIDAKTNQNGHGDPLDLDPAVAAVASVLG